MQQAISHPTFIAQEIADTRILLLRAPGNRIYPCWLRAFAIRHLRTFIVYQLKNPKPENERGTCLNPQAFGKSLQQGVAGRSLPCALLTSTIIERVVRHHRFPESPASAGFFR